MVLTRACLDQKSTRL